MFTVLSFLISFAPSPDQQRRTERQEVALEIAKQCGGSPFKEGDILAPNHVAFQFWTGPEHDNVGVFKFPSQVEAVQTQDGLRRKFGQAAGQRLDV